MARTANDSWDIATSVGAPAVMMRVLLPAVARRKARWMSTRRPKRHWVMRAVKTDARRATDSRMMSAAKQIAARRNVTCPAHHLGLGMA